jgi:DNA-binding MarR family transcriptional regulator
MRNEPRLFQLLTQAQRAVTHAAERESLARLGVTPVQLALLYALEAGEPVSMTVVGRLLDLSPAALSGLADRCVRAGLIERRPNRRDARAVDLVATERGAAVRQQSYPLLAELNARLVEGLDAAEQAAAAKFLAALVDRFGRARGESQ